MLISNDSALERYSESPLKLTFRVYLPKTELNFNVTAPFASVVLLYLLPPISNNKLFPDIGFPLLSFK